MQLEFDDFWESYCGLKGGAWILWLSPLQFVVSRASRARFGAGSCCTGAGMAARMAPSFLSSQMGHRVCTRTPLLQRDAPEGYSTMHISRGEMQDEDLKLPAEKILMAWLDPFRQSIGF
eukprot:gene15921-biopygen12697